MRQYIHKLYLLFFIVLFVLPSYSQEGGALDSLKQLLGTKYEDTVRIDACLSLIIHYYYSLDSDSALHYSEQSLELARSIQDTAALAFTNQMLAFVYDQMGYVNKSLPFAEAALVYYLALGDSTSIANAYNDLGYFKSFSIDQSGSLLDFMTSLDIAVAIQDSFMISYASSNIAYYYEKLDDYDNAYAYHKVSYDLDQVQGDSFDLCHSNASMSLIMSKMNLSIMANDYLNTSQQLMSSELSAYDVSNLYTNYIDVYLELENFDSIENFIKKQEVILSEHRFLLNESHLLFQKGRLEILKGNYQQSISYLKESLKIMSLIGEYESHARVHEYIAEAFASLGNYKQAYLNRLVAEHMEDSVGIGEVVGLLCIHEQEIKHKASMNNERLLFELEKQRIEHEKVRSQTQLLIVGISAVLLLLLISVVGYFLIRSRKTNEKLELQNELVIQQQRKLEQSLKKIGESEVELQKINATKDRLFSIIAHDLKNPLSAVMGMSELYLKDNKSFRQADMVHMMESLNQSATYGFGVLENLLEWARSNAGELAAQPEELDLAEFIGSMIPALNSTAEGKGIRIEYDENYVGRVIFDRKMLHTILRNLIHNAIKFSHESSVIVLHSELDGDKVILSVRDQGIGISKDAIKNLFSSESKYQRFGTKNEKGTGLGLLLCKDFVEKNTGRMWVESEEEKGSAFFFTLPVPAL